MNADVEIYTDESRLRPVGSEVNRLFGDNTLLRELTGWKPCFAGINGFERGLKATVEWFTDENNLKRYKPDKYMV